MGHMKRDCRKLDRVMGRRRGFRRGTPGWNNNRGNGGSWRSNWRGNGNSNNWRQDNTFRPVKIIDRRREGLDNINTEDGESNRSRSPSRERGGDRSGRSSGRSSRSSDRSSRSSRPDRSGRSSRTSQKDNENTWEIYKDNMNQEN
jgi:hypothetical protein